MSDDANSALSGELQKTEQKIAELNSQLAQISSTVADLFSEMEKVREELAKATENLTTQIESNNTSSFQKITTELNQAKQTITTELSQAKQTISTELDQSKQRISTELNQAKQKIDTELDKSQKIITTDLTAAKEKIDAQLAAEKTEHQTEVQEWKKNSNATLRNAVTAFNAQIENQESDYIDVRNKIIALLPEASAVGISKAFADEKKSRQWAMWINLGASYVCIVAIFILAIIYYKENKEIFSSIIHSTNASHDYFIFFVTFAKLLTIEAPLCWLATFTAKKAHQHHRVYEEYSHKYTAAMTYAGLCKETRDNPELYGKDSVKNLADGFRDAVYYNPSNEIDKKVELSSPLDIAESLVKSVGQQAARSHCQQERPERKELISRLQRQSWMVPHPLSKR